jgi:ParB family transcriptional regulator, chromosome partitioning protein
MAHANRPARADAQKNLPVDQLQRGRLQPRQTIDGPGLARLAESVQAQGVIQPLFVRKVAKGRFEILAGERRWQAAKMAGLRRVPTVIRNVTDATALAISLIENLHREDLNPMDQAIAIQRLVDDFSQTHAQVAEMIGRSRATVTNLLRLLELPAEVRSMIADGRLDMGHGRALLTLPKDECVAMAEAIMADGLSVREVERRVSRRKLARRNSGEPATEAEVIGIDELPDTASSSTSAHAEGNFKWLSEGVRRRLGDSSSLKRHRDGRWHLDVSFGNLDELREALASIEGLLEQPETRQFALTSR